eukprot:2384166-Amphidinium_carterae.1
MLQAVRVCLPSKHHRRLVTALFLADSWVGGVQQSDGSSAASQTFVAPLCAVSQTFVLHLCTMLSWAWYLWLDLGEVKVNLRTAMMVQGGGGGHCSSPTCGLGCLLGPGLLVRQCA